MLEEMLKNGYNFGGEQSGHLMSPDGIFKIGNEEELKLLLYGIDQRFYTTPDGVEKRIANSVIPIKKVI